MENVNEKLEFLLSLKIGIISSKKSTDSLVYIEQYLTSNLKNPNLAFSKIEYTFSKDVHYYISNYTGFVDNYFPFLTSNSRRQNIKLLRSVHSLFETKIALINSLYVKDIAIVEEYMVYARKMIYTGEMFFFEKDHENIPWAKKEFPIKMFNYLSYHVRINPKYLTEKYIQYMQDHFAFCNLGLDNKEKVIKVNQYFSKAEDPFSSDIPSKYDDVSAEIRMLLPIVLSNEKLFSRIVEEVKHKYLG
jgi:hypothetical protein